jgi:hypothetical protein
MRTELQAIADLQILQRPVIAAILVGSTIAALQRLA